MAARVFIDGAAGTTGLEISDRLAGRGDLELLVLDEARRKDAAARRDALNAADVAILCLPDDAARDAVAMIDARSATRIIDASSAHRIAPGWTYGFPELVGEHAVAGARRVSNPGCYPTGFLAVLAPLVRAGLLPAHWPYTVNAVSGFSGGGKPLIDRFAQDARIAFRGYGLGLDHKHLLEMQVHAGLRHRPVFSPAVAPAFRGMIVDIPVPLEAMPAAAPPDELRACLGSFYAASPVIRTMPEPSSGELLLLRDDEPWDGMDLFVLSDPGGAHVRLVARLDNLGKGASGAAVQTLNLMLGAEPFTGLRLDRRRG